MDDHAIQKLKCAIQGISGVVDCAAIYDEESNEVEIFVLGNANVEQVAKAIRAYVPETVETAAGTYAFSFFGRKISWWHHEHLGSFVIEWHKKRKALEEKIEDLDNMVLEYQDREWCQQ